MAGHTMRITGLLFGAIGMALLFLPVEILGAFGAGGAPEPVGQLLGALYLGFGSLNWTGRNAIYGGIYGRPIVLANFAHGFVGAVTLWGLTSPPTPAALKWSLVVVYILYAAVFMRIMRTPPNQASPAALGPSEAA